MPDVAASGIGPIGVVGRIERRTEVGDLCRRSTPFFALPHHDPRGDDPLVGVLVRPARPEEVADEAAPDLPLG